jgi:hypothetical protein
MSTISEKSLPIEYSLNSHYYKEIKPSLKFLIKKIYKLFNKKYSKMPNNYNMNIIENIIYNEKSHIVATFKDRLIIDDTGEFLKRYYKKKESQIRLPKFYEYYDLYSKIFPNYTTFYEGKYLYQNIQRKQRMIDLQEQMEMEEENNREKINSRKFDKEKVFNTDAIDSILNGTNNEGMEIIFNVNKNNIKQDEEIFNKEINNIIDVINDYESKNISNYNNKNKKIVNNKHNNFHIGNEGNKDNIWNKNISVPINLNYSKNKRLRNSNSMTIVNNTNITYYNSIQSIMSKFFNISSLQKNGILNFNNNNTNKNNKIINMSKYYQKKDKKLIQKLEQNLFKIRQKSIYLKNLSQNISTSNQTQKDISISKRNSSAYTKKQSSSTSSAHNQKNKNKDINNSSSYKITNHNIIKKIMKNKNIDIGRKNSPLTSRNPPVNKINLCQTKMKNIKNNINCVADNTSRNRYTNNMIFHNKAKSTLRGRICSSNSKVRENRNNNSNSKNFLNNLKNKFNESKQGYKEISYIKRSKNKSCIKETTTNNNNENKSTCRNRYKNKNNSQPKTIVSKGIKYISRNDSSLKVGILDLVNSKKKYMKAFNISNFSKNLNNTSNLNTKNNFSKTHRSSFGLINK